MSDDTRDPEPPPPAPPRPPRDFRGKTVDVPPPAHRLQLAPPLKVPTRGLKGTKADPSVPWDDIRAAYVHGVTTGPNIPDRTEILQRMGLAAALERSKAKGIPAPNVVKVGKYKVVFPALQGVAHYFDVRLETVRDRCVAEDWHGLQQLYRIQLRQKHGQAKTRQRLERVEAIDNRAHATARLGLKMVQERLELLYSAVDVTEDGEVRYMVDPREMDSLARAAQVWHALGRRALGFPVEQVGAMKALDAAEMADFGLTPLNGIEEDVLPAEKVGLGHRLDGGLAASTGIDGLVDDKPSVSTELAKDDAERLHGFLTVLGRAQTASHGEGVDDGQAELGDGAAQGEIGTGT